MEITHQKQVDQFQQEAVNPKPWKLEKPKILSGVKVRIGNRDQSIVSSIKRKSVSSAVKSIQALSLLVLRRAKMTKPKKSNGK